MLSRRSLFRAIGLGSAAWIGGLLLSRSASAGGRSPVSYSTFPPAPHQYRLWAVNEEIYVYEGDRWIHLPHFAEDFPEAVLSATENGTALAKS